jgi:hypothetical protein
MVFIKPNNPIKKITLVLPRLSQPLDSMNDNIRVCRIAGKNEPFLIWRDLIRRDSVVDCLSAGNGSMVVEDFLGRGCLVCDVGGEKDGT